ncbi:MAG: prepilin-type N-terminal cleavage/methylation domain-containing protein [Gemmatimonadales bacterium]
MQRKNGFTLVEMMIVVALIGAILLIGWPKVASGLAKTNLRSSRTTVANMFAKARAFAVQSNRRTSINFNGNNVVITASPRTLAGAGTQDSIGGVEKLSEAYGVALTAPVASVAYDPRGFGSLGAVQTFVITKSSKRDSVMIDVLGRVIK